MDKFVGHTSRNPNSPSAIKKRIASLRKQLANLKRVQHLLQKEKMLQDKHLQALRRQTALLEGPSQDDDSRKLFNKDLQSWLRLHF